MAPRTIIPKSEIQYFEIVQLIICNVEVYIVRNHSLVNDSFLLVPIFIKKGILSQKMLQLNVLRSTKRLHCLVKSSIYIYCKVPEAVLYCYKYILLENSIVSCNILR